MDLRYLIAGIVGAALPSLAPAADINFSGFGTAAYAQSDTDDADVAFAGQPDGIDSDGTFEFDSKFGMQVTASLSEVVSATVQGVAYTDLTGEWGTHLDWAYVRLQALPELSVRAGYLRTPTFFFSDSVFVGYSNIWVRPPTEVYGLAAVYQMRGVDATWRSKVGPVTLSFNPYYGQSGADLPGGRLDVPEWLGAGLTADILSFTARASFSRYELGPNAALTTLADALRGIPPAFCPGCVRAGDLMDFEGLKVKAYDIGVQYEDSKQIAVVELAALRAEDHFAVPDRDAGYVTYGLRVGDFMPYVTYAALRRKSPRTTNLVPATLGPLAAAVNAIITSSDQDQDTISVGVRYELPSFSLFKGAVVKAQVDHIEGDHDQGQLKNVQPGFDGELNVGTVSFDFIF